MDEREFELVNIIGAQIASSQRDLSRQMDLSLGMTNMLIRRLLAKGYIRIKQLDKKKVEYLLTPKGFAEKMQKSVKYTIKTLHSIGLIKSRLCGVLHGFYQAGERKFFVLGKSDLAGLIEVVLQENQMSGCEVIYIDEIPLSLDSGVLLICKENIQADACVCDRKVNVIEELAQDELMIRQAIAVA